MGVPAERMLLAAALAWALELALRRLLPLPYAPRAADLGVSFLLYALATGPALAVSCLGERWRARAGALLGAPFGLLLANLAFAFGNDSKLMFLLLTVAGLGLGSLFMRRLSRRALTVGVTVCCALGLTKGLWVGRDAPPPGQPSVLLIVLDTTAASHLSAYGYAKPTSPSLEALASRSLVYRRAISAATWTVPSHAAIFSGHFPSQLGFDGWSFDPAAVTGSIAGDLAASGRVSAGITANPVVRAMDALRLGFDAMWDEWHVTRSLPEDVVYRARHWSEEQTHGDRLTDVALDWVDRLSPTGQPWFLFLNYMDPHAPYSPPEREMRQFAPDVDPAAIAEPRAYNSGTLQVTDALRHAVAGLYDGEVAAMDRAIGRLLDSLARRGYDTAHLFVIITADHGESLGEHGLLGHQLGMPDNILHVPLLISGPGVQPGEISSPVQTVQLRNTVRALLGIEAAAEIAPALPPWGRAPELLISEHAFPQWYHDQLRDWNPRYDPSPWRGNWVAVERDGVKVVFNDGGNSSQYDLQADPGEQHPKPVSNGAELLQAYRALPIASRSRRPAVLSEEARSAMRSLGYIQ